MFINCVSMINYYQMCLNSDRSTSTDGLERDLKICANVELVCGIQLNWPAEVELEIGLPEG